MKNNKLLKIIIPMLMIIGIACIWLFQNQGTDEVTVDTEFPLTVTSIDLETLTSYGLPIIIDFGADECIPCKEMAPVLDTLNEEMQGTAIIQFVDVWKNPTVASDFPIQVIPTQVLINPDGTPYYPSDEIASSIEFTMYADRETEEHIFTTHQGGLTEEQMRLILADMGVEN